VWLPVPIQRLGYRVAYTVLRTYWFIRRPKLSGVKCVLTDGNEVLLVRHTYGPRAWDLPGGAIKRGEAPATAARREMTEELGVSIDDWRALGTVTVVVDHRRDLVHCFQAQAPERAVTIDRGELAAAGWFARDGLPSDLGRYAGRILDQVPAPGT
jgi:ADP-ribose pyrophosphatase YjhB (NUDIX family)